MSRGLIVGAGTGTGKTLAFYLPALLKTVKSVRLDDSPYPRILAIYPRIELLKDQATSALGQILKLNSQMKADLPRTLSIGLLYGDTPYEANPEKLRWPKRGSDYVCPYFRDPETGGELIWRYKDIKQGRERLYNDRGRLVCDEHVVRLTRRSLRENPPDLFFSTTEMLNRSLADGSLRHLYGLGYGRPPELVLLDEVHTYSGTHGAMVAYLLRRWRWLIRRKGRPHFTGLSATLAEAETFFAELTGLPYPSVTGIRADHPGWPQEIGGHEYLVAVRSDPFSGTSVLSTTIQTAMLLRRLLDPLNLSTSEGLFGQRVFIFTDDLDVTNRLYDDLADAEGLKRKGRSYVPDPRRDSLATLRSPLLECDEEARWLDGQSWRFVDRIGYDLSLKQKIRLDRVSSQDTGLSQQADVVVATASLEVGYDDEKCGAVIQHKAPYDPAGFKQRHGRAGRSRLMRPWTCVVLSDYGRDRIAYQNYEWLFDPELRPQFLLLGNRYVLKMQATFALIDWFALRLLGDKKTNSSVWRALSGPTDSTRLKQVQQAILREAEELLKASIQGGEILQNLMHYLQNALSISEDEVLGLLWDPPRALLTSVLPTIIRRLESNWQAFNGRQEPHPSAHPLPEFVPSNLFSDLNLPEVEIHFPEAHDIEPEYFEVMRLLKDFAPGRVNRRFGYAGDAMRHWIPVDYSASSQIVEVPVEDWLEGYEEQGAFPLDTDEKIQVLRPIQVRLADVPRVVQDTSNAFPVWYTCFMPPPPSDATELHRHEVSDRLPWRSLVREVQFYTHLGRCPVEVCRYTPGSEANILYRDKDGYKRCQKQAYFTHRGKQVALGFRQEVDAIAFRILLPSGEELYKRLPDAVKGSARTAYFKHLMVYGSDDVLGNHSVFVRGWLYELFMSVLLKKAYEQQCSIQDTCNILERNMEDFKEQLRDALNVLDFNAIDREAEPNRCTLRSELLSCIDQNRLLERILDLASHLWKKPDPEWLTERIKTTLGAALLQACVELTPGKAPEGLLLDLDPEREDTIWISEATLGGNGLIEAVQQAYVRDPRHFFDLVEHALRGSDLELVADELPRALECLGARQDLLRALQDAEGMDALKQAHEAVRNYLREQGVLCTHAVYTSLTQRLLRPGATHETLELLQLLWKKWQDLEKITAVEVEPRMLAYVLAHDTEVDSRMPHSGAQGQSGLKQIVHNLGIIQSLLWARGGFLRSLSLQPYNPFAQFLPTDRLLVLHLLSKQSECLCCDACDSENELKRLRRAIESHLNQYGKVRLCASPGREDRLKKVILDLQVNPIEDGFIMVNPRIQGVTRNGNSIEVELVLPEAVQ